LRSTGKVDSAAQRALRAVLPPRCVLCAAPGANGRDLCAGCAADLVPNTVCCPRCAIALEAPAPLCGACVRREPPFAAAWAPFRYTHPLDLLENRFKFHADLAAGKVLAELLIDRARDAVAIGPDGSGTAPPLARPDLIVCVPLHAARLRQRGYNQALELARPLAAALDVPLDPRALLRTRSTRAQTGLDAAERRRNLHGAFAPQPGTDLPAHVAIVDDVMTTGTTLAECAQTLRRAGVTRVDAWALARA
jgi:ComF family protein